MAKLKQALLTAEDRQQPALALGTLADQGLNVLCRCHRCGHRAVMPAEALIAQVGADLPVPELGAKMRCSGCGSRDVATRPDWPDARAAGWGRPSRSYSAADRPV